MGDIVFIAIAMAFFAVCVAYVRGLDRLVRASEEADGAIEPDADEGEAEQLAEVTS